MNPWINYHHLLYFKTIAEEGSVSKAAAKLRLGQPTLSAQLKNFENVLGVSLFERQHKKLILTEQGRIALDYAKSIFKMGSEMYEVLHDQIKPHKPTLHIGALDSVPKHVVLELVKSALKISPCQVSLLEGKSDELIRELTAHRIDLVLSNYLPIGTDAKGLAHKLLSKKNITFYGAKKYQNLKKNFPHSISKQPVILPTYDSKLRYDIDHWAKINNIELNIITETQDIAIKKLMATAELGIIPTAEHTVKRQVARGELEAIGPVHGVSEEIFILSAKRKLPNLIAQKIFEKFHF